MSEFVNTVDLVGDDALTDSILDKSITEIMDNFTTKINNIGFNDCVGLKKAHLLSVKEVGVSLFNGCTSLEEVEMPLVQTTVSVRNCTALKRLRFPSATHIGTQCLNSSGVVVMDCPVAATIGQWAFYATWTLKAVLLRNTEAVCELQYSGTIENNVYAYVPRALLASYKAATNWSAVPDRIRVLEDYTVDGTINGEFDESKI